LGEAAVLDTSSKGTARPSDSETNQKRSPHTGKGGKILTLTTLRREEEYLQVSAKEIASGER